ncbi:Hypothetical predicted protein [Paramuricea clavata]|uniref:Uncharacterized protein n=1 Tax=Paramuricea clavata TaxID=317549 RepID=A0A7D9L8I5_PARCT|nr:Hypothetical predicted protein [Paramuricea clavata]
MVSIVPAMSTDHTHDNVKQTQISKESIFLSPDLEVKYIGGLDPRMLFLENGEETERVALAEKSRVEINELLVSHGLTRQVESNEMEEETEDAQEGEQTEPEKPHEKIEF